MKSPFAAAFQKKLAQDKDYLDKTADGTFSSPFARGVVGTLGASALAGLGGYLYGKHRQEAHQENLRSSYNTLASSHTDFSENPDKFHQRFSELALISPTLASNPRLAHKVLQPRLDKGFDLDDVHRLAAIEYHSNVTPKVPEAMPSAQAAAMGTFGQLFNFLAPALISDIAIGAPMRERLQRDEAQRNRASTIAEKHGRTPEEAQAIRDILSPESIAALAKQRAAARAKKSEEGGGGMGKNSSASDMWVSEECMGRMLADRFSMLKTAGIIPESVLRGASAVKGAVGGAFASSGKEVGSYLKMMALPFAIGGGISLLDKIMKQRETEQMKHQADMVFNGLRRNNSYVKENPEMAEEAFDTLRSFAPALAIRPLVAKTFVEHVITSDGRIPPDTAKLLSETQNLVGKLNDATGGGFIEGLKSPMSLFKHNISHSAKDNKSH